MATIVLPYSYTFDKQPTGTDVPFILSGKAMTNPPTKVSGLEISSAIFDSSFVSNIGDTPYTIKLLTDHILTEDAETTLRDNSTPAKKYTLKFACIHKGLTDTLLRFSQAQTVIESLELSIVFLSSESDIYHINVPILIAQDSIDENRFLNSWLYTNPNTRYPPGFTFNQILNVQASNSLTKVATYTFSSIKEDDKIIVNNYTICRFKDPVKINQNGVPSWLIAMKSITPTSEYQVPTKDEASIKSYRPRNFNAILKIMLPTIFKKIPLMAFNNTIESIYYILNMKSLLGGMMYSKSKDPKKLQNIKCYPIDLATQVNDDGSVNLDTTGLKALTPVKESDSVLPINTDDKTKTMNTVFYWVIFSIIAVIGLCIVLAIVVTVVSGKPRMPFIPPRPSSVASRAAFEPLPTK